MRSDKIKFYRLAHDVNSHWAASLGGSFAEMWGGQSREVHASNYNESVHLLQSTQHTTVTDAANEIPTWIAVILTRALVERETQISSARLFS